MHANRAAIIAAGLTVLFSAPLQADEAAPHGGAAQPSEVKPYPEGINCVYLQRIRSGYVDVIDLRHLMIEGVRKEVYLLTLLQRCFSIDDGAMVGFDTDGTNLCAPGDTIVTSRERCPIQYLEQVTNTAEGRALVKARKAAEKASSN